MDAFDMPQIEDAHRRSGELYHEFLRADRLSVGLYVLEAGATDPQVPHTEDEVYYIVSGSAMVQVASCRHNTTLAHRPFRRTVVFLTACGKLVDITYQTP